MATSASRTAERMGRGGAQPPGSVDFLGRPGARVRADRRDAAQDAARDADRSGRGGQDPPRRRRSPIVSSGGGPMGSGSWISLRVPRRPTWRPRRPGCWAFAARAGRPRRTRCAAICRIATCCWCSTTASTWWTPAPSWPAPCSARAATSGSWPPAVSRSVSTGRRSGGWSRLRPTTRIACSSNGRGSGGRSSSPARRADATIDRLCARLDRLPLAIELAAARVSVMSPSRGARRVWRRRLGALGGGGRLSPPHHRTVRTAVEWSHQMLDPTEQRAFRSLAVFVGGFDAGAATAVAPGALARCARAARGQVADRGHARHPGKNEVPAARDRARVRLGAARRGRRVGRGV